MATCCSGRWQEDHDSNRPQPSPAPRVMSGSNRERGAAAGQSVAGHAATLGPSRVTLVLVAGLACLGWSDQVRVEWVPVQIGEELAGWTLTGVEIHPQFYRYRFESAGDATRVEVTAGGEGRALFAQAAPGELPPDALLSAVRAALSSAPDSFLETRLRVREQVSTPTRNWSRWLYPPERGPPAARDWSQRGIPEEGRLPSPKMMSCLSPDHLDTLLRGGATRDFGGVSPHAAVAAGVLVFATLLLGIVGYRRRGSHWLGAPRERRLPVSRDWAIALVLFAGVLAVFGPSVVWEHSRSLRGHADGEIFASSFWNALHGRGLYNAREGMDHLGIHASMGLYLWVPFYALSPGPGALGVFTAVQVLGSVAPAYLLARARLDRWSSLLIALVLLSFPSLGSLSSEFHAVKSALPLLLWALCFLEWRRPLLFVGCLLLAASFKENTSVVFVGLGAYLLLKRDTRWSGAFVTALGLAVYVVGVYVVLPAHFGHTQAGPFRGYEHLGGGLTGILTAPVLRPGPFWAELTASDSLAYLAVVFGAFALAPLAAPRHLLIFAPIVAQNILNHSLNHASMNYHYDALLLPGLVIAAVHGVSRVRRPAVRAAWLAVALASSLFLGQLIGRPLSLHPPDDLSGQYEAAIDLAEHVPDDVSLAAPIPIAPLLARRAFLTPYTRQEDRSTGWLPEYVVIAAVDDANADPRLVNHTELVYSNAAFQLIRDPRPEAVRCADVGGTR